MDSKQKRQKPKLDRRNAIKNIDYEASTSFSSSDDGSSLRSTRSLDLPPYSDRTSFRVEGIDGEVDVICRNLGLSGPDDFAIPIAAWEARKARSSSDLLPRSRLHPIGRPKPEQPPDDLSDLFTSRVRVSNSVAVGSSNGGGGGGGGGGGIKGVRPPVLAPPPSMSLPALANLDSTWDIVRSFAPPGEEDRESEEDEVVGGAITEREEVIGVSFGEVTVLSESCSFTTSNEDDCSSSTTEPMYNISPDGKFRRIINSWQKGDLLGSGSFGTVYEGIADDGFFFAVKEVSLLDQGSQGRQSIYQLEQEIALLSQFEHENIVRYLGTDKDEAKLYIFLELVTKGSLAKLYDTYHLWDSQVSAYTRQILNGLKYLHDQNVVHRDIKCANILVDASGSVKLADFGLAKATKLNDVKSCKGTAFWMAPEGLNCIRTVALSQDSTVQYIAYAILVLVEGLSLCDELLQSHSLNRDSDGKEKKLLQSQSNLVAQHEAELAVSSVSNVRSYLSSTNINISVVGALAVTCSDNLQSGLLVVVNRKTHGYGLPADIWSLGCTVLEMLTRQLPYADLEWLLPSLHDSCITYAHRIISKFLNDKPKGYFIDDDDIDDSVFEGWNFNESSPEETYQFEDWLRHD
ncbi:hypothetical protein HHK36_007840 [Tetracentron sinense]|uniref:mitogen-activated protein kinase kinase kinase n=1 Tax=Tetracentron sinense TaxID=13715 RepID=A0A835DJC8_TETSI|nr:hypothetical protein HHK36_007840 [Tetracentron sinense]